MAARAVASLAAAAMVAVMLLAGGASAQSPSSQCTSVLVSLSPCLNYISGNESTAPASCCTQLGKVVQSDPQCLCVALNADPASLGLNINRTRALDLPNACKVQTPPVSNCKSGAAAPTSPTSGTAPGSAGTGSKTTPTASADAGAASPRGSAGLAAGVVVAAAVLAGFAM